MNKGLETIRRTLVICLWVTGGCLSLICAIATLFSLLCSIGLIEVTMEASWGLTALYLFLAVIIFGLTFLLHVAINWIFQKG